MNSKLSRRKILDHAFENKSLKIRSRTRLEQQKRFENFLERKYLTPGRTKKFSTQMPDWKDRADS